WLQVHRFDRGCQGSPRIAKLSLRTRGQNPGQAVVAVSVLRVELNGFAVVFQSLVRLAENLVSITSARPGRGEIWVQYDGLGQIGQCLDVFARILVYEAPVAPAQRVIRVQLDGFGEVGDGLGMLAQLCVDSPPIVPGSRLIRVQLDGF